MSSIDSVSQSMQLSHECQKRTNERKPCGASIFIVVGTMTCRFEQELPSLICRNASQLKPCLSPYFRSAPPYHGFMILNRLGRNNFIESLTSQLEFQLQEPFLLYRKAPGKEAILCWKLLIQLHDDHMQWVYGRWTLFAVIYGLWFYESAQCKKLSSLLS